MHYDYIIVGAGSAGELRRRAAAHPWRRGRHVDDRLCDSWCIPMRSLAGLHVLDVPRSSGARPVVTCPSPVHWRHHRSPEIDGGPMSVTAPFSSEREAAPSTVAQHDRLLVAACRAAFEVLGARQGEALPPDAQIPVPPSTRALLARLPRTSP